MIGKLALQLGDLFVPLADLVGWLQTSNLWREITSPARGAKRLNGTTSFYDKSGHFTGSSTITTQPK